MSGIGPKIGGSYDQMRQGILDDVKDDEQGTRDNKIIRGDSKTGQVYLHHGKHSIGGLFGRVTNERSQTSQVLMTKLGERLGSRAMAETIFSDIGLKNGNKFEEFRIGDFDRIEARVTELQDEQRRQQEQLQRFNNPRLDDGNIRYYSEQWQQHAKVPENLERTERWQEEGDVPAPELNGYNDHNEYTKRGMVDRERSYVPGNIDKDIGDRIRSRLEKERDDGKVTLPRSTVMNIIRDEVELYGKNYKS